MAITRLGPAAYPIAAIQAAAPPPTGFVFRKTLSALGTRTGSRQAMLGIVLLIMGLGIYGIV